MSDSEKYNENIKVEDFNNDEYEESVNQLKSFFRKQLEKKLIEIHLSMKNEFTDVLGEDFSVLINKRANLLKKFKDVESELLRFAIAFCGAQEDIKILADWIQDREKARKDQETGKQLFQNIMNKVDKVKPELVVEIKDIHANVVENTSLLTGVIKGHQEELASIEKKFRTGLQKNIVDFILEYTQQLNEINEGFGKEKTPTSSPFDGDYQIPEVKIEVFDEDDDFISFKGNYDVLN